MENRSLHKEGIDEDDIKELVNRWGRFLDGLQLKQIVLEKVEAFQKPDSIDTNLQLSIDADANFQQDGTDLVITSRNILTARNNRKIVLKIDCTFLLFYDSNERLDDFLFDMFKRQTLSLNIHPFFRELVHSMTTRMGLPPLALPLYKTGKIEGE